MSDVCQAVFTLAVSSLWKPASLLAKLNFAICELGKYSLILQIFSSTYLLGWLLVYLGLVFSCNGSMGS